MSDWQPIETAPKDGTAFLATDGDDHSIVKWDKRRGWVAMGDGFLAIASQGDTWTSYIEPLPTHWMPLPKPPVQP